MSRFQNINGSLVPIAGYQRLDFDKLSTATSVSEDDLLIINDGTDNKKATVKKIADAIINDSISVTGNGVKTRAQLLNELYALVDYSKFTEKSVLVISTTCYHMTSYNSTHLNFSYAQAASSSLNVEEVRMSSNSSAYTGSASSSGYTRSDDSSTIIPNGMVIKLIY